MSLWGKTPRDPELEERLRRLAAEPIPDLTDEQVEEARRRARERSAPYRQRRGDS